ncbi:MAG: transglutaminase family protein [Bradymonadia bacterium]
MRIRVRHHTRYLYDAPAMLGPHVIRLHPVQHTRTHILTYALEVSPEEARAHWQQDPWGNRVLRLTFADEPITEMGIEVEVVADIQPVNPFDFYVDERCQHLPFEYPDGLGAEVAPYLATGEPGPELAKWLEGVPTDPDQYVVDYLVALNTKVAQTVDYVIRMEPGVWTSEETLLNGRGSCRDSAVLLVDALRARGLAARFVSGYLVQLTDEGIIPDLPKGVTQDVVDLHAWAEVYLPGAGWVGLDGTSGLLCGEGHIPLACTASPLQAAPITGTASSMGQLDVQMTVERLGHEPSPRKPLTEDQWSALKATGDRVDAIIEGHGVTLTMGGEPTWTSREHPREKEWITEALGPTKWAQGLRFAEALQQRFGEGGLPLSRMGKLYPGESLPRWNLELWWRTDGVPLWKNPERLGFANPVSRDGSVGAPAETHDRLEAEAKALGEALCATLGVAPNLHAAYEDPWHFTTQEQALPVDVDPLKADLTDSEERRRLARVLDRGLGRPAGQVIPLTWDGARWASNRWSFRRGELYLIPGDSPVGLRLPLDRITGQAGTLVPRDVTEPQGALPDPAKIEGQQPGQTPAAVTYPVGPWLPPLTALVIEPDAQSQTLNLFLPPLPDADRFVVLLDAIEGALESAGIETAVRLEGYPPPKDSRLSSILVSPDPGVIEVNLPVTSRFADYVKLSETLSDAANHSGLSTEKYQLDGREVGSGGGHHLTLGGPSTTESVFLQRPDVMAGFLKLVQRHPCMSYFFTGLFVGPTSQAPRIDEARMEVLDELELALDRLVQNPGYAQMAPPWLVDRALRNLLVDVSGNTHRAEICIDKLYSPAHAAGRQGIIELRAFEMPPHERMAAAQMLLVRALVARCLAGPVPGGFVRWGHQLHDRFMLPHFLWADLLDLLGELRSHGIELDPEWFRPFIEYRFPIMGRLTLPEGINVEIRPALEPWPVLGEEPTGGTVSRFVDSSLERLQLKVTGFTEGRHVLMVNGLAVPLHPTDVVGEQIAGVKFRAWQPAHCLHPSIGVHHPLHFDVVDTWHQRSLGRCTYHVWHPEGRAFEDPPLTAFEAGARRAQRFTIHGNARSPVRPLASSVYPRHPYTLDLRLYPVDRPLYIYD